MKKKISVLFLCAAIFITAACSTAWVPKAIAIIDAVVPAVTNILQLVGAFSGKELPAGDYQVVQQFADEAKTDLSTVKALIDEYQAAPDSGKPAVLAKISAALNAASANLNKILPALHIKNAALQSKVTAIVGLVIVQVDVLAAIIPAATSQAKLAKAVVKVKSAKQFKADFNKTMTAPASDPTVDGVASSLTIH